jgi:hypothetical protein
MLFVVLLLAVVAAGALHVWLGPAAPRSAHRAVEILLVYLLAGYYGVAMCLADLITLRRPEAVAALKGWPASPQIQTLHAFALLELAASALPAIWIRGDYLLAPALGGSVLLLGGAYVHGSEILAAGRFIAAREGPEMVLDLVVPLAVLGLALAHQVTARS